MCAVTLLFTLVGTEKAFFWSVPRVRWINLSTHMETKVRVRDDSGVLVREKPARFVKQVTTELCAALEAKGCKLVAIMRLNGVPASS